MTTAYLKAADVMRPLPPAEDVSSGCTVAPGTPLPDLLRIMLEERRARLVVMDGGEPAGVISERDLLEGLGRMIAPRDDSSVIELDCPVADYSASRIASAVEAAEAHLVDLWTMPTDHGTIRVTLRVRHEDPSACVHQLERYGYEVTDASGAYYSDALIAEERLAQIQMLLNV